MNQPTPPAAHNYLFVFLGHGRFTFLNPDLLLKLDTASDLGVIINDLSNARNKLFTSLQRGGWQIYLIVCRGEDGRFINSLQRGGWQIYLTVCRSEGGRSIY